MLLTYDGPAFHWTWNVPRGVGCLPPGWPGSIWTGPKVTLPPPCSHVTCRARSTQAAAAGGQARRSAAVSTSGTAGPRAAAAARAAPLALVPRARGRPAPCSPPGRAAGYRPGSPPRRRGSPSPPPGRLSSPSCRAGSCHACHHIQPVSDRPRACCATYCKHTETRLRGKARECGPLGGWAATIWGDEYPLSVAVFWDRLIGAQGAPPEWVVAASALAALLVVASPLLWRTTRIAITIVHESGHAAASLLSGRKLEGIRLHADTSGETVSRGRRNGPGIVVTAMAGYVTPPLLGIGACALLAAHRVTLLLSLLLLLLAVTLVLMRNWYGVLIVLITGGALFAVIWFANPALRAAFAYAVAWFLLFGGVRPVVELARTRTRAVRLPAGRRLASGRTGPGMSDADQLDRRRPAGSR